MSLAGHFIKISMKGLHLSLQLPLGTSNGLFTSLTLGYPFSSDLDLWLAKTFQHFMNINAKQSCNFCRVGHLTRLSLVITTLLDELNFTTAHYSSSDFVAIPFFLMGEANNVKGRISHLQLLIVINGSNSNLALGYIAVVIDVIRQEKVSLHVRNKRL